MKKLTSKKGFTLIEMLVVIAIIAVLVAIIVPTVSSSTAKAKYATDAANLRTAIAECEMKAITDDIAGTAKTFTSTGTDPDYTAFTPKGNYGTGVDATVTITIDKNGKIEGKIAGFTVNEIASSAESGDVPTHAAS